MAIIKCPECGRQVSDQAKTCPNCGVEIEGRIMRCPECGEVVFKSQDECPSCHYPFHGTVAEADCTVRDTPQPVQVVEPYPSEPVSGNRPDGGKRDGKIITIVAVALVVVLLIVFGGMYYYRNTQKMNEYEAYENAMGSDEPAVLQNFLDMYTDAPAAHRDSVSVRLDNLKQIDGEWANAVASGSKAAIERYLKMFPTSAHVAEAKVKIDSLDWVAASNKNTPEAYQEYIDSHADGMYVDDARDCFERLDAQKVTPADEQAISSLFSGYFTALSSNDEDGVTACVANVMTSFLHKADAAKTDVINHMKRINAQQDMTRMTFRLNNDWKITKTAGADGSNDYAVAFSVDQKVEFTDPANNTFNTFKVEAKVSSDMKITELNMKKVVQ